MSNPGYTAGISDPAFDVIVVTPSDTVDLPFLARFIRAGVAGDIKITTAAGNSPTLNFAAGETRAIRASRIWATGTTATDIEAMY